LDDLPKTRSGKIMRRILWNLVEGRNDQLSDTTTLSRATIANLDDSNRNWLSV
jgi:hypothetical protein